MTDKQKLQALNKRWKAIGFVLLATLIVVGGFLTMIFSSPAPVSPTPTPTPTPTLQPPQAEVISYKGFTLENGLWYTPYGADVAYIRIFSIGGANRIAEISNYPRAYRDTVAHVYAVDTSFTVIRDNYNTAADDAYYDSVTDIYYHIGDKATHYAGDSLPGAFPRWIEYGTLQPVTYNSAKFPLDAVPKPIDLQTISLLKNSVLTDKDINTYKAQVEADFFELSQSISSDRQIVYFHYKREL